MLYAENTWNIEENEACKVVMFSATSGGVGGVRQSTLVKILPLKHGFRIDRISDRAKNLYTASLRYIF